MWMLHLELVILQKLILDSAKCSVIAIDQDPNTKEYANKISREYGDRFTFYNTSSTAQGGGGSFKDRKPIGEVDCCDAWMAEQSH